MPKKQVSVEVESSGYDIMQAVGKVVKAQKASGAGLQEALADLMSVISALQSLPGDFAESKLELVKGINLGAYDVAEALVG